MKPIRRLNQYLRWCLLVVVFNLHASDSTTLTRSAEVEPERSDTVGRDIYNFYCYFCHGYAGDAQTLASRFLSPPPRNFTATSPEALSYERMREALREGRPETAMKSFRDILDDDQIDAVISFIRSNFMTSKQANTRYHTEANGWFSHERFRDSFPFATGAIPLDTPSVQLTARQRSGLQVYLQSCISCHDRSRVTDPSITWDPIAISYPRGGFKAGDSLLATDARSGASPFTRHDIPPSIPDLTPTERIGEQLFQANCAFCHGADGSGKNWIGTFLEPHPRDLTDPEFMAGMTGARLMHVVREGLPGTSMPAWKSVMSDVQIDAVVRYIHRAIHPLPGILD